MSSLHVNCSRMKGRLERNNGKWEKKLMHAFWSIVVEKAITFDIWVQIRLFLMLPGHAEFFHVKQEHRAKLKRNFKKK